MASSLASLQTAILTAANPGHARSTPWLRHDAPPEMRHRQEKRVEAFKLAAGGGSALLERRNRIFVTPCAILRDAERVEKYALRWLELEGAPG